MKKYLAVFMIALMAVSIISAAGVVTAQKASATPAPAPETAYIVLVGQDQAWTGRQCNYHYVSTNAQEGVKHEERSAGASASAKDSASPGVGGGSQAAVGVQYMLTSNDWETQKTMPVKVTVSLSYTLKASGEDPYTSSDLGIARGSPYGGIQDSVLGQGTKNVKQVTLEFTKDRAGNTLTVEDLAPSFALGRPTGTIDAGLFTFVNPDALTPQTASASATVNSISIDFLDN